MKYLKLYESFKEEDIHEICKKYNIENYTINEDGSIDVDGDVNLYSEQLTKLPLKFGRVTGNFDCSDNKLTSLVGCPSEVGKSFRVMSNQLTSLNGCPKEIGGSFRLDYNNLTSLDHFPKSVGGGIEFEGNPVEEIYRLFPFWLTKQSFLDSLDYNYFRGGNKINKIRLSQALAELGLECPENIRGYVWE